MTPATTAGIEADRAKLIRQLRELIQALDRRVPRLEREGEVGIARDASALRAKAVERLARLGAPPPHNSPA